MSKTLLYVIGAIVAIFVLETFSKQSSASTLGIPSTLLASNPTAQNVAVGVAAGNSILGSLTSLFKATSNTTAQPAGAGITTPGVAFDPAGDPTDYLL